MNLAAILLAGTALFVLGLSLVQTGRLAWVSLGRPGIGRVLFFNLASLKLWAALVAIFFLANTLNPGWAGDDDQIRLGIRFFFVVYLIVQPVAVNIAIYRWSKRGQ